MRRRDMLAGLATVLPAWRFIEPPRAIDSIAPAVEMNAERDSASNLLLGEVTSHLGAVN